MEWPEAPEWRNIYNLFTKLKNLVQSDIRSYTKEKTFVRLSQNCLHVCWICPIYLSNIIKLFKKVLLLMSQQDFKVTRGDNQATRGHSATILMYDKDQYNNQTPSYYLNATGLMKPTRYGPMWKGKINEKLTLRVTICVLRAHWKYHKTISKRIRNTATQDFFPVLQGEITMRVRFSIPVRNKSTENRPIILYPENIIKLCHKVLEL